MRDHLKGLIKKRYGNVRGFTRAKGLNNSTVYNFLEGVTNVKFETFAAIFDALDIKMQDFFTGEYFEVDSGWIKEKAFRVGDQPEAGWRIDKIWARKGTSRTIFMCVNSKGNTKIIDS